MIGAVCAGMVLDVLLARQAGVISREQALRAGLGAATAWWHGLLADAPRVLGLTVPVRRPTRPGVAVRCRLLDAADRTEHRGLPVTALGLTALEAAAELGDPSGAMLDRALWKIGWSEVLGAYERNPTLTSARLLAAAGRRAR